MISEKEGKVPSRQKNTLMQNKEIVMKTAKKFKMGLVLGVFIFLGQTIFSFADPIQLSLTTGSTYLYANQKNVVPLKVGLTGFYLPSKTRTPVNVSIVLDKSGSMGGDKIERAKEAAIMAISLLDSEDIVSVVAYDDTVEVIVPATKARDRERIIYSISHIYSGNSTALFAGVCKGVEEVRKFYDRNRVNRVILLSDGMANVGPSSTYDLGELGMSLRREGISVTTLGLGLGYNEDLMVELAGRSDGNHSFIENANDLSRIFNNEFGDILSVVAQDIQVMIQCREGVRPIRLLGREGDIHGQTVITTLNQLYSNQEKFVLLEVEVPASPVGRSMDIAQVEISYANMLTKALSRISGTLGVTFTESQKEVERTIDKNTMVDYVKQNAIIEEKRALELRDKGRKEEAQQLLLKNAVDLSNYSETLGAPELKKSAEKSKSQSSDMDSISWEKQRKSMKNDQYKDTNQQKW